MDICKRVNEIKDLTDSFIISTNCADIKLYFLTDEIIRVRASFDRAFPEESYVLMTTAWEDRLDSLFEGERTRISAIRPEVTEQNGQLFFKTKELSLAINRDPFEFTLTDSEGTTLYSTCGLSAFTKDSNQRLTSYTRIKEDDAFYGFGENTGSFDKNKSYVRERATDCMGYDPQKADTLYKHIPFYIRLDRSTHKAVGVFYHNFYESEFNMGAEKSNYWPRYTTFRTDGGDIDMFLIGGNKISKVVDNYTLLTGRPALLPKRALGYQGSSMYYSELEKDCDDELLKFVETVHKEGFPIDGFHLSSGYTSLSGKRYVFCWNKDRFKDPRAFFKGMADWGAKVVPNVKPGVLLTHPLIDEFEEKNVFVADSIDPSQKAIGKWWGGEGVYFDYTKEEARCLWKEYLKKSLIENGTYSIWNDNCEYDGLLDKDAVVSFDGKGGTIGALKPIMANLMCKLSGEAITESDSSKRPYSVCRAGASGIQKYAQTWCGDNYTSWKTLKNNVTTILGMGLSGQPNEGADIGGFAGPAPSEELFVRWVQNGIFQPRFSIHSASTDNTVTEPWMYPDSKDIVREMMLMRYRFIPYLYSLEYKASVSGSPIMRPLVYEFQEDENVYEDGYEFMFGRDILVANVLEEGQEIKDIYLPKGCKWYDAEDEFREYEGGQLIQKFVSLDSVPMFVREGAIIPMAGDQPMNLEKDPVRSLRLILAPGQDSEFLLYDDDGTSNDYKSGVFHKTHISKHGNDVVDVDFAFEGNYEDRIDNICVEMIKKEKAPLKVCLVSGDGKELVLEHFFNRDLLEQAQTGWYYNMSGRFVVVRYETPRKDYTLRVSFEEFDVVGM